MYLSGIKPTRHYQLKLKGLHTRIRLNIQCISRRHLVAPLPKITTVLKPERTCGDLSAFKSWRGRKTRVRVKEGRLKWKEKQVHSSL